MQCAILLSILFKGLQCNFDVNYCGWQNDRSSRDDFNWKRGLGRMATQRGSGPTRDHTGGNDQSFC